MSKVISKPLEITIGKIANPASNATNVSKEATITQVWGIDISLDKYGRILANVYTENGVELSNWAIEKRFAVSYDGGTKKPPASWSEYHKSGQVM